MPRLFVSLVLVLGLVIPQHAYAISTDTWEAYNNEERGYSFLYPGEFLISYEDEFRTVFEHGDTSFTFFDYRNEIGKDVAVFIEELWGFDYDKLSHPIETIPSASINYLGERNTVLGGENLLFNFVSPNYASDPDFAHVYDAIVESFFLFQATPTEIVSQPEPESALEQASTLFPDLDPSHWANTFVSFLKDRQIIRGYDDGRFGPNDPVTDEQIIKIVLMSGGYDIPIPSEGPWYTEHIQTMKSQLGSLDKEGLITVGTPSTRAEVIAYAMIIKGVDVSEMTFDGTLFSDVSTSEPFALYIEEAKRRGYISGYAGGTNFGPNNPITRAEVSKIAYNIFFGS